MHLQEVGPCLSCRLGNTARVHIRGGMPSHIGTPCRLSSVPPTSPYTHSHSSSSSTSQVSDEGEILYSFDPNFRDRIRNKSLRIRLESTAAAVKDTASYLARVTFGTALLASVVTVALAITVIASSGNQSNDRDRRGNGGYYRGGPQFYFNITDLLW